MKDNKINLITDWVYEYLAKEKCNKMMQGCTLDEALFIKEFIYDEVKRFIYRLDKIIDSEQIGI